MRATDKMQDPGVTHYQDQITNIQYNGVHRWLVQYNFDNIRTPVIIGHTAVKYGAEGHLIRLCVHIIFVMSVYFHDL